MNFSVVHNLCGLLRGKFCSIRFDFIWFVTMNEEPKKLGYNSVMEAPWQTCSKSADNQTIVTTAEVDYKRSSNKTTCLKPKSTRRHHLDILLMRFPGLNKCKALAALTISNNQLDQAILILEMSNCFRGAVISANKKCFYLKDIHINIAYDFQERDPTLRNVVFESVLCRTEDGPGGLKDQRIDNSRRKCRKKIGVVIVKTTTGYKAKLL